MYFLEFQSKDLPNYAKRFYDSYPVYVYKCYAFKKSVL